MEQKFYCKVDGRGSAKRPHATLEIAATEAHRLHAVHQTARRVEILQVIAAIEAVPGAVEPAVEPEPKKPRTEVKQKAALTQKKAPIVVVKKSRKPCQTV